ncbi:hypothetical protein UFOVP671_31 [uncultured Caudovirales phage]|uniref:Uncharacterized protein n=1 Tax=uncultured Caudovirales phage TaxID=2100421 RepID=A0A6J5N8D1_9CAUD|nr:hypothetical protein UFOVP671_31 [uncultured Caudovirales phage]
MFANYLKSLFGADGKIVKKYVNSGDHSKVGSVAMKKSRLFDVISALDYHFFDTGTRYTGSQLASIDAISEVLSELCECNTAHEDGNTELVIEIKILHKGDLDVS